MNKYLKKFLSVLLSVVVLFVSVPSTCFDGIDLSGFFSFNANAADEYISDIYTYTFKNGRATIVRCDPNTSGEVVIPQYLGGYLVTAIGDYAFDNCTNITSVSLPDGILTIGEYAFGYCFALTDIYINDGLKEIGDYAFAWCSSLKNIIFPNSLTDIGDYSFYLCQNLENIIIPDSVTSLGAWSFTYCNLLKKIHIGAGVTELKEASFDGCSSLTEVTGGVNIKIIEERVFYNDTALVSIEFGDKVATIGDYAFYTCYELSDWSFPDSLRTIGAYAFFYTSLTSVFLKEGLNSLGKSAFANCLKLKTVTIPGSISSVAQNVFENCESLEELTFGIGVQQIESRAFYMCRSLKKLTLPDSMVSICGNAFYGCSELEEVKIGEQLSSIGDYAFSNCESLSEFLVDENNENYAELDGVLLNKDKTTLIIYPQGNKRTHYTVPSCVKNIETRAFYSSRNLTSVSIPESVETIGNSAFNYCSKLVSINIFSDDVKIERYAFDQTGYYNAENNWDNGVLYLDGYLLSAKKFIDERCTIREGTVSIADYAFYDNELIGVVIPESVENIGEGAFYYCVFLSDIVIGENVKNIGKNAFYRTDYYDNEDIWISNELYIDNYLIVADKTASGFYDVKDGTIVIADDAFNNCKNIDSIVLPESFVNFSKEALKTNNDITVYTYLNSQAVEYCKANDIEYKILSLEGIEIDTSNAKTTYILGDVLETDGVVIYALLGNNIKRQIDLSEVSFSKVEMKRPVKYRVTVEYRNFVGYYNIVVREPAITSIEILTLPDKMIYSVGESLDSEGLTLAVHYQNGTKADISSEFEISGNTDFQGESTITVSYTENGQTVYTSYTVTVIENLYPVIFSKQISANIGEVIRVPISITNNNGFMGFGISIEFNSSIFEPLQVVGGENLSSGSLYDSIGGNLKNGLVKIVYSGDENVVFDGVVFYVDFLIKEEGLSGDYEFVLSYDQGDTFNEEWDDVKLICSNFIVAVESYDDSKPLFFSEDVVAFVGQKITVPIMGKNVTELSDFNLTLSYDSNVLKCISVLADQSIDSSKIRTTYNIDGIIDIEYHGACLNSYTIAYVVFEIIGMPVEVSIVNLSSITDNVETKSFSVYLESGNTQTDTYIYSDVTYVIPNQLIEVPLYVKNNNGLMGMGLQITYNSDLLTPVSVKAGEILNTGMLANSIDSAKGTFKIIWNHSENIYGDGLLLTLQFTASENVINTDCFEIDVKSISQDTYNELWENVELTANDITLLVDQIIIKADASTVGIGNELQLYAKYVLSNKECDVIWSTDNKDLLSVNSLGIATAVSAGLTTVTASSVYGEVARFEIKISPLISVNHSGAIIDRSKNWIYGLDCGTNESDLYICLSDNSFTYVLLIDNPTAIGTESIIQIKHNGVVFEEYTIVIFGDVNGDGWYDGEDAFLVNLIVAGMLDRDDVGEAIWTAADCNHDGVIDELDVDLLVGAGLLLNKVDQSATPAELALNSDYIEYTMLIDQSVGMTTGITPDVDNPRQDTADTNTTPEQPANEINIEAILTTIFDFIKKLFTFVFSFIIK